VITYRSFKKLLGETSLERKCRYLFGAALLGLIAGSFWLTAAHIRKLVYNQEVESASTLIQWVLMQRHYERFAERAADPSGPEEEKRFSRYKDLIDVDEAEEQGIDVVETDETAEPENQGVKWSIIPWDEPAGDFDEEQARLHFEKRDIDRFHKIRDTDDSRSLRYFEAVVAEESCLKCHTENNEWGAAPYKAGQHVAVVRITRPWATVDEQLSVSQAILVGSAIVTTGLAMLAAYIIVRYIIVKPVLHLTDVSDAIANGNLTQRAEISTGDEFEELSHAFNRMLRHMTTVNGELRTVNDNLDAKVDLLAQANMELFNSNRLKDDFLATVSHELRTPLNSILGFSDILASAANLDDRQKRYVDNIQTSGQNLMTQINDLLDLAKIESGQMEIQAGTIDLQELIDKLVQQITPLAEQKNIDVRVIHPSPPAPPLQQDGGKLQQILTNLLSNAIKFTPEGGRVRVSSRFLDEDLANSQLERVEVAVEDTGIGIPLQQQEDIFEKFRQGATLAGQRDHAKREYGGTGLGLSIVRELSRLLGGDVSLESEFGKGSVFTVTLPVEVPIPEEEPEPTLESSTSVLGQITSVNLMHPNGST